MAVAIEFGSQGLVNAVAGVATVSSLTFNAEASDRLIAASIAVNVASLSISGVTIGGVAAIQRVAAVDNNKRAEIWAAAVPTGTTGTVVVTLSGSSTTRVSVSTHSITGADGTPTDSDSATGSAASISITALTIATDGAGISAFCNADDNGAVAWTGADETHDTDCVAFRHSSAIVTASGTNTITADGSTQQQALVGVAWGPAAAGNEIDISERLSHRESLSKDAVNQTYEALSYREQSSDTASISERETIAYRELSAKAGSLGKAEGLFLFESFEVLLEGEGIINLTEQLAYSETNSVEIEDHGEEVAAPRGTRRRPVYDDDDQETLQLLMQMMDPKTALLLSMVLEEETMH